MPKVCSDSNSNLFGCKPFAELHTLRHLLSDIYDPLTSITRRQSHVHPIVCSLYLNQNANLHNRLFHRLSDHSSDHLNIKSIPFSLPSPTRIKSNGSHLIHFPRNGSLLLLFHLFRCTDHALNRLHSLAQLLDPNSSASVDLTTLKSLCAMGLPDQPPSLRPRAWRLLLGLISPDKDKWSASRQRSRTDYLVCSFYSHFIPCYP
jgi:hypothetical protein